MFARFVQLPCQTQGYAARLDSVAAYLITSATPHAHPPSDSTPQSSQQEQPPPTFAWPEFIGHARALSEARGGQNGDSSGKGGVSSWDLEGVLSAPGSRCVVVGVNLEHMLVWAADCALIASPIVCFCLRESLLAQTNPHLHF